MEQKASLPKCKYSKHIMCCDNNACYSSMFCIFRFGFIKNFRILSDSDSDTQHCKTAAILLCSGGHKMDSLLIKAGLKKMTTLST
jgi:hypothetical protein